MNTYPLIRTRWSNEHLLAVLFFAVSLYQLPDWVASPVSILKYVLLVAAALVLDVVINYIRYQRPVCAVSAAVTAAVLYPAVKGLPGWAGLLGIAAALIVGKHIWGGTGKNIFNPAATAMFFLSLAFPLELRLFEPSYWLLPALVLSFPFIAVRPFPGVGLIAGMAAALFFTGGLNLTAVLAYGILFWGCVVITDPATATDNPYAGLLGGFATGVVTMYFDHSLMVLSLAILLFNAASFAVARHFCSSRQGVFEGIRLKAPAGIKAAAAEMIDLTEKGEYMETGLDSLGPQQILERIRRNGVFGMGGAGFSTADKIRTVLQADTETKYLIINGMECDPGLVHDKWLMENKQREITIGIEALRRCVSFKRTCLIAKKTEGLQLPSFVEVVEMPDRYPYGAEKLFVSKLTEVNVPAGSNPAQQGILVLNVQTVYAVYEAVCLDKKADTRFMTVLDLISCSSRVVRVKLGERLHEIIGKTVGDKGMVFAGGGLMQAHAADEQEVVSKTTNCLAAGMLPRYKESTQCIGCGLCSRCCPAGINVRKNAELIDHGKLQAAKEAVLRCMSCGSCSYVCLAGRNLSGRMLDAKQACKSEAE